MFKWYKGENMKFKIKTSNDVYGCGYRGLIATDERGLTTTFVEDFGNIEVCSQLTENICEDVEHLLHLLEDGTFEQAVLEEIYGEEVELEWV